MSLANDKFYKLLRLSSLIQSSIVDYLESHNDNAGEKTLPSVPTFNAQKNLLAAAGLITELVSEPSSRLIEVSMQYFEARALHVVAGQRIPDILAAGDGSGVSLTALSAAAGIEARKLGRIMRCLCSIHIFKEVSTDYFANNEISVSLVQNEPLRAYILMFGLDIYTASDSLPRFLTDPEKGPSYDVRCTPWQDALTTTTSRWEWLEESTSKANLQKGLMGPEGTTSAYHGTFGTILETALEGSSTGDEVSRPEHQIFAMAMLGGGRVFGQAHLYDFPWSSLGKATVVDVGGGVGGFSLQLSNLYPDLSFVVQDRGPVLEQARSRVWPQENPSALQAGRVQFLPHDFFTANPTKDADIYWLRYILHDWADDYCIQILSAIRASMGPKSRILICDQVMSTTVDGDGYNSAPAPLPANWGYYTRYSHQRDLAMMAIINGIERNPAEIRALADASGLRVRKFWDCRSQVGLVELVLPESALED